LVAQGLAVGVLARTQAEVEATAASIRDAGGEARAFPADVLDPAGFERAFEKFMAWSGRCDVLVCAAGRLQAIGPMESVDPDAWWLDLETSIRGTQRSIRAALPSLRRLTRASISVLVGPGHHAELAFASGYGAAQAALVRLVESLAREFSGSDISIFAVYPGLVPTALTSRLVNRPDARRWLPQFNEAFSEGKEVGPEVVAEMVAWLSEKRPASLTGRVVPAPSGPAILESRLTRIEQQNLGLLRLR
jgi:NAD(P)-dependent dehydrogenase (short-subunit alcohol dehydrogenase family)